MMRARKQLPSTPTVVEVAKDMQATVWAEVSTRLLRGLRALLEGLLEAEVTSHVGRAATSRPPPAGATATATTAGTS